MTVAEQVLKFLGEVLIYGGTAAAIAYLLFQYLGKTWIENKFAQRLDQLRHQQALELQRLRVEIDSLLSGVLKLQEKDDQPHFTKEEIQDQRGNNGLRLVRDKTQEGGNEQQRSLQRWTIMERILRLKIATSKLRMEEQCGQTHLSKKRTLGLLGLLRI